MSDIKITWDNMVLEGVITFDALTNDLVGDDGLSTSVIISLFTDARAKDDDALPGVLYTNDFLDRRGWWADETSERQNDSVGSRLWLLSRAKNTTENLIKAEGYVKESLQWMLDEGIVSKIDCTAEAGGTNNDQLRFEVQIQKYSGENVSFQFETLWKETI